MKISFRPIWFDSLGAKSSCTWIETPEVKAVIDPGIAVMQPSFPAPWAKKLWWKSKGAFEIKRTCKRAQVIIITHYHYDHYFSRNMGVYRDKLVLAKNPNQYINDSQRKRAEEFYERVCRVFGKSRLVTKKPETRNYPNPLDSIPIARDKEFGSYARRRQQLLKLGLKWFWNRARCWNRSATILEPKFERIQVRWADGKTFKFGKTKLRFTQPMFHGIEFSRVGWVIAVVIERGRRKLIHSSDLNGIYVEDYAEWIVKENPNVLILDGPPTYMGFMLIKTNLQRCLQNALHILNSARKLKLIIYDHHLLRERSYRQKTQTVWESGKERGIKVLTAAELLNQKPVIDTL